MPPSPSKPRNEFRQEAELYGRHGETAAAWFLRLKGYRILQSRYKTPLGEIDLIARRLGVTVFVEVKSRRSGTNEREAMMAVNDRRIVRAAEYYLTRHPELMSRPLRFDVIFLAPRMWPRHVRNAFQAR